MYLINQKISGYFLNYEFYFPGICIYYYGKPGK